MLTGDLKTGALWAAEIFALPSHQENFGIAVVEALACGVPALISNKVNIWREIEQDQAGLVENDDETGAFNLLRRWFSLSADQRQEYRAQARCCFANRFEIRRAARSLIALLEHGKGSVLSIDNSLPQNQRLLRSKFLTEKNGKRQS
jgi:glycosyltransferase involved in cell wall biosynthesis